MTAAQNKRHGQVMAMLVISLSIACIFQAIRIEGLKRQTKDQSETIERYANTLFEQSRDYYLKQQK